MSSNTVLWLMTSIVASEVYFSSIFVNHTKSYFGSQGKHFLSKRHWLQIYIYWFINQVLVFKSSMVCKKNIDLSTIRCSYIVFYGYLLHSDRESLSQLVLAAAVQYELLSDIKLMLYSMKVPDTKFQKRKVGAFRDIHEDL